MRSTFALSALLLASPALGDELVDSVCHLDGFETPVRCVSLEVPLDYSAPQSKSITIAAAVAPALTARPAPDPLFVFAGGPGQAGTDIGPWLETAFRPARRARDVVLLDFRGTGRSGALRCDVPTDFMPAASSSCGKRALQCARARRRGCAFYTHREVVEDIERVRLALGYEKSIFGAARSARASHNIMCAPMAPTCAAQCSTARRRSAVDLRVRAATAEAALERLFADCTDDAACARAFPSLRDDLAALLARAESEPIAADVADPRHRRAETRRARSRHNREFAARRAVYPYDSRGRAVCGRRAAARGDLAPLLALGAATGEWSTETMALGFTLGILCSEDVAQSSTDDAVAATTTTGFLRDSYYRGFAAACEAWPTTPLPPTMLAPLRTTTRRSRSPEKRIRSPRRRWATQRSRSSRRRCT